MTVESNYVATLNDWLQRLAPAFQLMSKLQIIATNCYCFITLFAPVVIGRSNCFGFGFSTVI